DIDQIYLPLLNRTGFPAEDVMATLVEHFSLQIKKVIVTHMPVGKPAKVLTTGGGAYHRFFIDRLIFHCGDQVQIIVPHGELVNFKEALVFAFLGVLRLRQENNCLKSVTGASMDS